MTFQVLTDLSDSYLAQPMIAGAKALWVAATELARSMAPDPADEHAIERCAASLAMQAMLHESSCPTCALGGVGRGLGSLMFGLGCENNEPMVAVEAMKLLVSAMTEEHNNMARAYAPPSTDDAVN